MPVLQEPMNLGDLLKYEAPNLYSRERVIVAAGQTLALGTVLGLVTATGKVKQLDPSATDGSQYAAGVLMQDADAHLAELMRGGNAYFVKNAKGNVVLMAENIKEHDRPLAGFKRRYRKAEGVKRLKRGADIPIAVLVPRVVLKKRLDVQRLVAGRVKGLSVAIEKQIRTIA